MEHTARLAVIEQNAKTPSTFAQSADILLALIDNILEYPREDKHRRVEISSVSVVETALKVEGTIDFLQHIGFEVEDGFLVFPQQRHLDDLRMAKSAIERKMHFINGHTSRTNTGARRKLGVTTSKHKIEPSNSTVLKTSNPFLASIENMFNQVLKYEDEELLAEASELVPLVTLQMRAIDRLREQQKSIKEGSPGEELPFETALLAELLAWFKESFFQWVDKPQCTRCGVQTTFSHQTTQLAGQHVKETCRIEWFKCPSCRNTEQFVRYNNPRELLRERRGRCGEWANCFTLLCRCVGFDTRFVLDTTDHVWCEVYDAYNQRWVHCDPCENALDTPLMYEHGWNKQLEYVIAYSRDDLQDVTWRYSSNHKRVLSRRHRCSEMELVNALMALRAHRQEQVSEVRRSYLRQRTIAELVELMLEKQPSDYESKGRISGSKEWRQQRGEYRKEAKHTWKLTTDGEHSIQYFPATDKYVCGDKKDDGWQAGTWSCDNIFRKVENDWKMVYLARIEGESPGTISWRVEAVDGLAIDSVTLIQVSKLYETGIIEWSVALDDREPTQVEFQVTGDRHQVKMAAPCRSLVLSAALSGGNGNVAWQHAQLFRQPLGSQDCALQITVTVVTNT